MDQRISSLHDDFLVPYDFRFESDDLALPPPAGTSPPSFFLRLEQFGIPEKTLQGFTATSLSDLSPAEYASLLCPALQHQYDVAFASIYAEWKQFDYLGQWKIIENASKAYHKWGWALIGKGDTLPHNNPSLVLTLEGADCIVTFADVERLYKLGIRNIMLQYNIPNHVALNNGLTTLGRKAVDFFLTHNVIVDLAHSNPRVRADIFEIAQKLNKTAYLTYSHGSFTEDIIQDKECRDLAKIRGITLPEVKQLLQGGGILGLGVSQPFFQTLDHLAERFATVIKLGHPEQVALGTDFGGFGAALSIGIDQPAQTTLLRNILKEQYGYPDAIIAGILRTNVRKWLEKK